MDTFSNFKINPMQGRIFHFTPDDHWDNSYIFAWIPGYFLVLGDMGNILIQNYSFQDFKKCLIWLEQYATPNCEYFMEKVKNFKKNKFNAQKTKESLIDTISQIDIEDIENIITEEFLDCILGQNERTFPLIKEKSITIPLILEKLKKYNLTEIDLEEIVDSELIFYDYDWNFLNPRIEAINAFAKNILNNLLKI